ncbi:hypothetical protein XELAEV_18036469mg [Xenopus laevis]|uniref:Uncharacterized protein n=1 Tax=Xenopus laevis TaxID=8355 RepID=A0A974CHQ3_XENLA|nr:hypothetical protein XELAEV_18036469mg [Xenopus laevis]
MCPGQYRTTMHCPFSVDPLTPKGTFLPYIYLNTVSPPPLLCNYGLRGTFAAGMHSLPPSSSSAFWFSSAVAMSTVVILWLFSFSLNPFSKTPRFLDQGSSAFHPLSLLLEGHRQTTSSL